MPTIEKISRENIELRDAVKRRTAEFTIRAKTDHGIVIIEVEDNGPGIPDEINDKILQPFFTTKNGTEGTGLRLSFTNDIVKAHGGSIKIKSNENEGAEFTIALPI